LYISRKSYELKENRDYAMVGNGVPEPGGKDRGHDSCEYMTLGRKTGRLPQERAWKDTRTS